jgi:hypothetical protein
MVLKRANEVARVRLSVRQSVRLFTCISAVPTGQISVKFDIGDFYENLCINSKFD